MVELELDAWDIDGMDSMVVIADFIVSIFVVVIGFSVVIDSRTSLVCQVKALLEDSVDEGCSFTRGDGEMLI